MALSKVDRDREFWYPTRDFLCLACVVPGGCRPDAKLCLWRADRSEPPNPREVQLLSAVRELRAKDRVASVREVARQTGVSPTAVTARIERAVGDGLVARGWREGEQRGLRLTPLGWQRLADVENRRPELALNVVQRRYYHLLATLRDLEVTEAANRNSVTATMLGSALDRERRSVVRSLRSLAKLALIRYDRGWVELTDAGRHLLETLRAYAVNVRLGPRLVIRARGRHRVQYLRRVNGRVVVSDVPGGPPWPDWDPG